MLFCAGFLGAAARGYLYSFTSPCRFRSLFCLVVVFIVCLLLVWLCWVALSLAFFSLRSSRFRRSLFVSPFVSFVLLPFRSTFPAALPSLPFAPSSFPPFCLPFLLSSLFPFPFFFSFFSPFNAYSLAPPSPTIPLLLFMFNRTGPGRGYQGVGGWVGSAGGSMGRGNQGYQEIQRSGGWNQGRVVGLRWG